MKKIFLISTIAALHFCSMILTRPVSAKITDSNGEELYSINEILESNLEFNNSHIIITSINPENETMNALYRSTVRDNKVYGVFMEYLRKINFYWSGTSVVYPYSHYDHVGAVRIYKANDFMSGIEKEIPIKNIKVPFRISDNYRMFVSIGDFDGNSDMREYDFSTCFESKNYTPGKDCRLYYYKETGAEVYLPDDDILFIENDLEQEENNLEPINEKDNFSSVNDHSDPIIVLVENGELKEDAQENFTDSESQAVPLVPNTGTLTKNVKNLTEDKHLCEIIFAIFSIFLTFFHKIRKKYKKVLDFSNPV